MNISRSPCFVNKGLSSQGYGFSSSHVWMWELDYKESWGLQNWWFWTRVLEKTLESPLAARRSNQSILKEISPGCSLPLSEFFVVCLPWMICSWSTEMIMWFRPFFLLIWCVTLVFLDVKPILYLLLYFFYMNYKMSFWNFTKFKLIFKLRYLNKHLYGIQTTYPRIWHAFLFPHVFSWVFVF